MHETIGANQIKEATQMLQTIQTARENFLGKQHVSSGEIAYVLGLLCIVSNQLLDAKKELANSLQIFQLQLGEKHQFCSKVSELIQKVENELKE